MALPSIEGLELLDAPACARLGQRLAAAGYDGGLIGAAEAIAPLLPDTLRLPLVRAWLEERGDAAATLGGVFAYRQSLPTAGVREALGDDLAESLRRAGVLVSAPGDRIASAFLLMPLGDQWFLSDYLDGGPEAVMGPGMTTLLLHRLLEAAGRPGSVLDVGCGAASLAIAAARRGAKAVAVDIGARACALARFNARLDGVTLEVGQGDATAPVAGRTFDLVLAQPPYVPAPPGAEDATYLHGGRFGDELALRFAAGSARALAPGGTALLHFDSAVRAGQPLHERLREAIGDAPVDLVALVDRGPGVDQQAVFYAASAHPDFGEGYARSAIAYRRHLRALGVTEISRVLLVLRRPRAGETPGGRYRIVLPSRSLSALRPAALFELLEGLERALAPDAALLRERLSLPAGVTFVEERDAPDGETPVRLRMVFPQGSIAQDRELGERGWVLLGLLGSGATVAQALERFAEACEARPADVRAEVLGFVREGLAQGILRAGEHAPA